jgi:hypothetical protein
MPFVPPLPDASYHLEAAGSEQVILAASTPLDATLTVPHGARAIVALLYASSAGRYERHHRFVAEVLGQAGLATLEVDLLTPEEEAAWSAPVLSDQRYRVLVDRIEGVLAWLAAHASTARLTVGLCAFGAAISPTLQVARESSWPIGGVACNPDGVRGPTEPSTSPTLWIPFEIRPELGAELAVEFFVRQLCKETRLN